MSGAEGEEKEMGGGGKGEKEDRRLFMLQWPSLWTTAIDTWPNALVLSFF